MRSYFLRCTTGLIVSALTLACSAQTPAPDLLRAPTDSLPKLDLLVMPAAYNYQRLGLFCKLDVQLERRLRIPVLFRLGDARQVEAMEGKGPLAQPRQEH